jgi:hypothetical protein
MATIGRGAAGNVALRSGAWLALLATATIAAAQPGALPPSCVVCTTYQSAPADLAPAPRDAAFPDWAAAKHRVAVRQTRAAVGSVNPW